jgi:hypothetical protein
MKSLLVLLAACGDNITVASDATDSTCIAAFTGNFVETSASQANCPQYTTSIEIQIASATLGAPLGIRISATPATGEFSSETVMDWSALAIENVSGGGACVFTAGATSVPAGDFTLSLDDGLHGTFALTMFVLPRVTDQGIETDCGAGTTEQLALTF